MIPTWYVTYEVRKQSNLRRQQSHRETSTFTTEREAKMFARAKFDEGLAVFASPSGSFQPPGSTHGLPTDSRASGCIARRFDLNQAPAWQLHHNNRLLGLVTC
jgi:hypothetical protein